jgi:hypothetical protein
VSFWERHRSAILTAAAGVFLLLVAYLGYMRASYSRAEEYRAKIANGLEDLAPYYPEIKGDSGLNFPRLAEVRRECQIRTTEYEAQLKDLTARLRFPFDEKTKVPAGERPGLYVVQRTEIVRETVEKYVIPRGSHTQLPDGWLAFTPEKHTNLVTEAEARESLRRLALAERVCKLAIDQGATAVVKVRPEKVRREAAYYIPKGKRERVDYDNAFIVNYPVSITMVGSLDSIMKFFHSVRGERHFLVIQAFNIVGPEDGAAGGGAEYQKYMRQGDVMVTISAACMDFEESKKPAATRPGVIPAEYVPPRRATGF